MKQKFFEKLKLFFRTLFFILGIMIIPVLILDLIVKQQDLSMLWWVLLFSAFLTFFSILFDELPIFKEKLLLKRIALFIILTAIAMGTSWIMGIITTVPVLLSGIAGCAIVFVPLTVYLIFDERRRALLLDKSLKEYNESTNGD